nr:hypothetical protein [Microseira wollei]
MANPSFPPDRSTPHPIGIQLEATFPHLWGIAQGRIGIDKLAIALNGT